MQKMIPKFLSNLQTVYCEQKMEKKPKLSFEYFTQNKNKYPKLRINVTNQFPELIPLN